MSSEEVFTVLQDLAQGHTLLTPAQMQTMRTSWLGWDNAVSRDCGDNGRNICKNGGLGSSQGALSTYAGILNCSMPVVIFANSAVNNYLGQGDIIDLVTQVYANSAVPGTTKPCP